ncbi:MAG: hypothetical protein CM1200mP41_21730 [Gammaproteobacteria bacterium]|nr:MAG: hypothetical protein CM1200mP41_21730 [Gammaproteobacteria bacterium]
MMMPVGDGSEVKMILKDIAEEYPMCTSITLKLDIAGAVSVTFLIPGCK